MPKRKTIVVIGSTGHFGGRLCRRLVGEPGTELVVTSRCRRSADALAGDLRARRPDAAVRAVSLDQSAPAFGDALRRLHPDVVVHTAGPYQGQDYRVARACIDCGSHYIDLADGRDFVDGFPALDAAARRQRVLLITGASTLPAVSSAVIDSLRERFDVIEEIAISIAPAHRTPRGAGTIAAVLSYCGKPFRVLVGGEWVTRYGWQDLRRQTYPALGRRLSGACDVPDLTLLPAYVASTKTVTFHAALEAPWEQLALWSMGWLTRLGLVSDWNRFVPAFRSVSNRLIGLGSDTGGMHIRLSGRGLHGEDKVVTWYLTARKNHGPEIPCAPALILARKLVRDGPDEYGAYACLGKISLPELEREIGDLAVSWEAVE